MKPLIGTGFILGLASRRSHATPRSGCASCSRSVRRCRSRKVLPSSPHSRPTSPGATGVSCLRTAARCRRLRRTCVAKQARPEPPPRLCGTSPDWCSPSSSSAVLGCRMGGAFTQRGSLVSPRSFETDSGYPRSVVSAGMRTRGDIDVLTGDHASSPVIIRTAPSTPEVQEVQEVHLPSRLNRPAS